VKKMSQTILKVEGMTCNHCKMRAEKALQGVSGVESVKVDLAAKEAVVTGEAERATLVKAVVDAGYSVVE
jgi:copper chaperone CopZ